MNNILKYYRKLFINNYSGSGGGDPTIPGRVTILEDNEYKITYFAEINAAAGIITIPTGATILLDQLFSGVDAYTSTIQNNQPTGIFPKTGGGVNVDVSSFDAMGNYTLTGTPSSFPVSLIYILKIKAKDYSNLDITKILDLEAINKQDTLVSGVNIKTINSSSILGSGNLVISSTPALTQYYIGVGNGSNLLSGSSDLIFDGKLKITEATRMITLGGWTAAPSGYGAIYFADIPGTVNYAMLGNDTDTYINAATNLIFQIGNSTQMSVSGGTITTSVSLRANANISVGTGAAPVGTRIEIHVSTATRSHMLLNDGVSNATIISPISGMINQDGIGLYGYLSGAWRQLNNNTGNDTLVGGTKVVSSPLITATCKILVTGKGTGVNVGFVNEIKASRVNAISFTVTSSNVLDTQEFDYLISE